MTRFVGDAVGVRKGGRGGFTSKDRQKALQKFIETGSHPQIERAQAMARTDRIVPLPEHDPNRDFVFMDLTLGNKPLGRLVIELFVDHVPVGANHLRNRCLPGSKHGLAGSAVHKLHPGYAMWFGKSPGASEGMRLPLNNQELRHCEAGAVSLALDGEVVCIALGRSLTLDMDHQVVGRVHKGGDILTTISDLSVTHEDLPLQKLVISKSGATNAAGNHEELDSAAGTSKKDAVTRLKEESADARQAVLQALAVGLGQKRAPEESAQGDAAGGQAGPCTGGQPGSGSTAGVQGSGPKPGAVAAAPPAKKAKAYMDAMLGDLSEGSSSDSDSSGGEAV